MRHRIFFAEFSAIWHEIRSYRVGRQAEIRSDRSSRGWEYFLIRISETDS